MEVPKILWLKKNTSAEDFARCQFFDLPDFLTYRATNRTTRSACSITCKESYVPGKGWQSSFFENIGLPEIVQNGFKQMGATGEGEKLTAGVPVGQGLSKRAAEELGLLEGTPVGSGLIDAYVYFWTNYASPKLFFQKIRGMDGYNCCVTQGERRTAF
jgi:ribulose kinase